VQPRHRNGKGDAVRNLVVLLFLGAMLVPAVAWADSTPRTIASGEPGARALARRPGTIVYSGDGAAFLAGSGVSARYPGRLRWTSWNDTQAYGTGSDWHNDCTPSCVDGTFYAYPAYVHLYDPAYLGGQLIFTRMTVTYPHARPPYPAYRSGRVTMRASFDAQYDSYYLN
jgi:hypothetical protein